MFHGITNATELPKKQGSSILDLKSKGPEFESRSDQKIYSFQLSHGMQRITSNYNGIYDFHYFEIIMAIFCFQSVSFCFSSIVAAI